MLLTLPAVIEIVILNYFIWKSSFIYYKSLYLQVKMVIHLKLDFLVDVGLYTSRTTNSVISIDDCRKLR